MIEIWNIFLLLLKNDFFEIYKKFSRIFKKRALNLAENFLGFSKKIFYEYCRKSPLSLEKNFFETNRKLFLTFKKIFFHFIRNFLSFLKEIFLWKLKQIVFMTSFIADNFSFLLFPFSFFLPFLKFFLLYFNFFLTPNFFLRNVQNQIFFWELSSRVPDFFHLCMYVYMCVCVCM